MSVLICMTTDFICLTSCYFILFENELSCALLYWNDNDIPISFIVHIPSNFIIIIIIMKIQSPVIYGKDMAGLSFKKIDCD